MKTFKLYLVLFLLLGFIPLHSQDITIDLSIRWNEGPYILNTDSIVKHPELVVSYTNNSKENLYFRKFPYYREGVPDFLWSDDGYVSNPDPEFFLDSHDWMKKHRNYKNYIEKVVKNNQYKNDIFYVMIDIPNVKYNAWFVIDEDSYDTGHGCPHVINRDCMYINEFLSDTIYKNEDERNRYELRYKAKDITKHAIKNEKENQFMLLKAGETKEDVFNLTCFDLAKGTYTFILNDSVFSDNVLSGWDTDGNKIFLPLPKKVGKYKLYSGKFTANTLTVTF